MAAPLSRAPSAAASRHSARGHAPSAAEPHAPVPLVSLPALLEDGAALHPLTHIPEFPTDHPYQDYRAAALHARNAEATLRGMRERGEADGPDGDVLARRFDGRVAASVALIRDVKARVLRMPPTPGPDALLDPLCRSPLHADHPDFLTLTVAQAIAATMIRGPLAALSHPIFGQGLAESAEAALKTEADEPGAAISKGRQGRASRRRTGGGASAKGRGSALNPEADWWRTHEDAAGVGVRLFLLSHAEALEATSQGRLAPTLSGEPDALQATDALIDSDLDLLWTVMTGRLTVGGVLAILYRELRWTGHLSIAQLGKALLTASGWAHIPDKVKDRLGGLKRFITRFPAAFHVGSNHPFNPQVCLRDSVGVFLWISMDPDEATAMGLSKATGKKKSRGKGKRSKAAKAAAAAASPVPAPPAFSAPPHAHLSVVPPPALRVRQPPHQLAPIPVPGGSPPMSPSKGVAVRIPHPSPATYAAPPPPQQHYVHEHPAVSAAAYGGGPPQYQHGYQPYEYAPAGPPPTSAPQYHGHGHGHHHPYGGQHQGSYAPAQQHGSYHPHASQAPVAVPYGFASAVYSVPRISTPDDVIVGPVGRGPISPLPTPLPQASPPQVPFSPPTPLPPTPKVSAAPAGGDGFALPPAATSAPAPAALAPVPPGMIRLFQADGTPVLVPAHLLGGGAPQ